MCTAFFIKTGCDKQGDYLMNVILLSGGSGKRLWPLSNDIRSRQFIKIFKQQDGSYESMIQRVCRQIKKADNYAQITIATSKSQASSIHNQLEDTINVCIEPARKNTFPVIALTAAYLHDVQNISEDEVIAVCPIDPYVEDEYFLWIKELADYLYSERIKLALMGVTPDSSSEKYGYIIPETQSRISKVRLFKEKPGVETATKYIKQGALWNGGVFVFQLKYVLQKAHQLIDFTDYEDLYDKYETLDEISFDYAIVEKEKDLYVMHYDGLWKDISTWDALSAEMTDPIIGQGLCDATCQNLNIVNELNVPVLCMGLKNVVVSASPEGILVSEKQRSREIEAFVDRMEQRVMYAEKSWGDFRVLDVEEGSLTIKATLNPGYHMNYHSHDHRDEVWTILSGNGRTIVDGMEELVGPGDVITMEAGCKHTIIADTKMQLIEVQLGKEINVHDKHKYELED